MAAIMYDFSFAYMKEAFVATLLVIAGNRSEKAVPGSDAGALDHPVDDNGGGDDDLDDFEIWREMKKQVLILREDMDSSKVEVKKLPPPSNERDPDDPSVIIDAKGTVTLKHPSIEKLERVGKMAVKRKGGMQLLPEFVPDRVA